MTDNDSLEDKVNSGSAGIRDRILIYGVSILAFATVFIVGVTKSSTINREFARAPIMTAVAHEGEGIYHFAERFGAHDLDYRAIFRDKFIKLNQGKFVSITQYKIEPIAFAKVPYVEPHGLIAGQAYRFPSLLGQQLEFDDGGPTTFIAKSTEQRFSRYISSIGQKIRNLFKF